MTNPKRNEGDDIKSNPSSERQKIYVNYERFYNKKYRVLRSLIGHCSLKTEERNKILKQMKEIWSDE